MSAEALLESVSLSVGPLDVVMTSLFCFASIQLRPIADHDMLTVGRSARDLLRKKIAL